MKFRYVFLLLFCTLALSAPAFSQGAGEGNFQINTTLSPDQEEDYAWPNAMEPTRVLLPGYTFSFNVNAVNTDKYMLVKGYPKPIFKVESQGAVWHTAGNVHSIFNAVSLPVSPSITIEARWTSKSNSGGSGGSGAGSGDKTRTAKATVRLANSDVVWVIPKPVVVITSPEFGELFFETSIIDTDGNPFANWVFNDYDVVEADPQNANWEIIGLGQIGPNGRHGLVKSKEKLKSKIQISYNDGNPETRKSKEVNLLPVEIVTPIGVATELHVAKMEDSLDQISDLDIDSDPDRFFVQINGFPGASSVSVKLATENSDGSTLKGPTEIELHPTAGVWATKSLLLVADSEDDRYQGNDVGENNKKNDRTHIIKLGGQVAIKSMSCSFQSGTVL